MSLVGDAIVERRLACEADAVGTAERAFLRPWDEARGVFRRETIW